MGAEFILPGCTEVLGLVERFGLGLWDKDALRAARAARGGGNPGRARGGLDTDRRGAARGAGRHSQSCWPTCHWTRARERRSRRARRSQPPRPPSWCRPSSSAGLRGQRRMAPSVAGGNGRVAEALAAELGGDVVHLGEPVRGWPGARAALLPARMRERCGRRRASSPCPPASSGGSSSTRRCAGRSGRCHRFDRLRPRRQAFCAAARGRPAERDAFGSRPLLGADRDRGWSRGPAGAQRVRGIRPGARAARRRRRPPGVDRAPRRAQARPRSRHRDVGFDGTTSPGALPLTRSSRLPRPALGSRRAPVRCCSPASTSHPSTAL